MIKELIEKAPDAMLGVDDEGIIVAANWQICHLVGYTREQLVGQRVEILVPERYRANHAVFRQTYLENPRPRIMGSGLDLYVQHHDGLHEIPVDISLSHTEDSQGVLLTLVGLRIRQAEVDVSKAQEIAVKEMVKPEIRRQAVLVGICFVLIDLIITLSVVVIVARQTRASDKHHSQVACRNTSRLARIEKGTISANQANTQQIFSHPYLTLVVHASTGQSIGTVKMPVFGLPPAIIGALRKKGSDQNQHQLDALTALTNANCQNLAPPKIRPQPGS